MASCLLLCLKTHTALDLAMAFTLDVIHVYTLAGCGTLEFPVEQPLASMGVIFCVVVTSVSVVRLPLPS